ncbi:MAG: Flp pilus assembly complex ATPase component TadA [Candidatus Omnitrophica bacterium]|nr:Flp pilus assembly complex ATPase component TadA [Candidatus Omnitrophota bacterium]
MDKMRIKIGEILLRKGLITSDQLEDALMEQRDSPEMINQVFIKKGLITEEEVLKVLSEHLSIPYVNLKDIKISSEAVEKVPAKFSRYYKIIPIEYKNNKLTIATSDPFCSVDDLSLFLKCDIEPLLASEKEIMDAIRNFYGLGAETVEGIIDKVQKEEKNDNIQNLTDKIENIEISSENASVIELVNQIILEAYQKRATDIHIEPYRERMGLRYRIDGILYDANVPAEMNTFFSAIISRVKIMAKLDIVERRFPQDGRAIVRIGKEKLDLRISVLPTRHGEGIVIRILPTNMLFDLAKLGLEKDDLVSLEKLISKTHGVIFVTGPTGSGKTTTLYACLNKIKNVTNKIITLENPVEYELEGISQIQISPEIGFTFAQGLKSALRHDPDIMMVGEVRDFETAELAIRIALTGHLLFSTIHTNDSAGGVNRLVNIGIEPFLVASSVEAFIAQRLLRVICPNCKKEDDTVNKVVKDKIIEEIKVFYNNKKEFAEVTGIKADAVRFYKGQGCEECNFTGYNDRIAIYEILVLSKEIKELILEKASSDRIRVKAIQQGMRTLRISGWKKVLEGVSAVDEVMRITQME